MNEPTNDGAATPESNAAESQVADTTASGVAEGGRAATPAQVKPDQPATPTVNYEAKYKELQRAYTQETQKRSALEKQWGGVSSKLEEQAKILAELRKQPYDREKFLTEFQDKGPEVLRPIWSEDINALKNEHSKAMESITSENRLMRANMALMERRFDTANYPDFAKLEPVINEMMSDPNCPVDFSKPFGDVLDILYQMARQTSSVDAVREAEAAGAAKAESRLVKESKSTVTGGGKAAAITPIDPSKMTTAEYRKHLISINGVVDRD